MSSVDDFYLTSNGLAVIETTNGNMNATLWDRLSTSSVLSWVRVTVGKGEAKSAKSWTELFAAETSGTYNNQWMVLDMALVEENKKKRAGVGAAGGDGGAALFPPLKANTFMILEQLPGPDGLVSF